MEVRNERKKCLDAHSGITAESHENACLLHSGQGIWYAESSERGNQRRSLLRSLEPKEKILKN